jgi:putative endonuclease
MTLRSFFVYILTNRWHTVLYTGVTNDLERRLGEHRSGSSRFTARYNVGKLVYLEEYADPGTAIAREKQIKAGSRARKIALVERLNPTWRDLSQSDE